MCYFLSSLSLSLQTYWLCMAYFIFPFVKLTVFLFASARHVSVFCFSVRRSSRRSSDGRWLCQTFNIILKTLRWKVIFPGVCWKGPLSPAFIRFGQASIKSVWHSSAPLCIVRLRSEAVMLEDGGLILARYRPCAALCRQVNCQMKEWLTLIIQIAWV